MKNLVIRDSSKREILADSVVIAHTDGELPTKSEIQSKLTVIDKAYEKKYKVLYIYGSHGDINGKTGKTSQLNGCTNGKDIENFTKALRDLELEVECIVLDFCFSLSLLAEFYPLLNANGLFVGWASNCPAQRADKIDGRPAFTIVKDMITSTEQFLGQLGAEGSPQSYYNKTNGFLHHYAPARIRTSLKLVMEDTEVEAELKDQKTNIKRIKKKRVLSTNRPAKRTLKGVFGFYWLIVPNVVKRTVVHEYRGSFLSPLG